MMRSRPIRIALLALALTLFGAGSAGALTLQQVGPSFAQPTYVTSDPGNPDRLFVVERKGAIRLLQGGTVSLFADLSLKVGCSASCSGERGLMSIALAPDFGLSGRLFVEYIDDVSGVIHVDELLAPGPSHDQADPSTLRPLLSIPHPDKENHNGGQLQIGPDGYLYASTGDGGGRDDQFHNAQTRSNLLGKILRINPRPSGALPYTIPAGNPFSGEAAPTDTIWAYGLRNPFRFSFDRLSGDLTIGDVGQEQREEVNFATAPLLGAGANYGWNCREGLIAGVATDPECATPPLGGFADPVFEYSHASTPDGEPCAIIGGYVVRDHSLDDLYGRYLYGDLCVGQLRSLSFADPLTSDRSEQLVASGLNSFGEDSCGRLYVVEGSGGVYRLEGAVPASCAPVAAPANPSSANKSQDDGKAATPTFVTIKAERRQLERGERALLTISASPCAGRPGTIVGLLRNGRANGSHLLDRNCKAHFKPLIQAAASFAAITHRQRDFLPGKSRSLRIRLAPPPRR